MSIPHDPESRRCRVPVAAVASLLLSVTVVAAGAQQRPPEAPEPSPTPPSMDEVRDEIERQQQVIEDALQDVEQKVRRDLRHGRHSGSDTKVSIGSSVQVEEGRVAENVVAIGGSIKVDGEVVGDTVAIMGSVKISGRVTGDVVAVMGGVELGPEAEVLGDVVSVGGRVDRESGATVVGSVSEVAFAPDFDWESGGWWPDLHLNDNWRPFRFFDYMAFVWAILALLLLVLVVSLVLLVAPNAVSRVEHQVRAEPWKSGLVGLALQVFFLPVLVLVCVILAVSIIGIPLLLLVPFVVLAFVVAALLGYTGSALGVGRAVDARFGLKQTSSYLILLLGVGVIQSFSLFGDLLDLGGGFLWFFAFTFGLFGFFVRYLAWTLGLGAVFLTRFGTVGPLSAGAAMAGPPPLPPVSDRPGGPGSESGSALDPAAAEGVGEDLLSSSSLAEEGSDKSAADDEEGDGDR